MKRLILVGIAAALLVAGPAFGASWHKVKSKSVSGEFAVTAGAAHLRAHTEATADWQTFRSVKLGTLVVANDQTTISLRPTGSIHYALMEVQSIKLLPKTAERPSN